MAFQSKLGTSLLPNREHVRVLRPFRLPQLALTCGPAAVLRRVSLHDEDVRLRSQIPRLAPPRARVAHRSGSGRIVIGEFSSSGR